MPLMTGAAFAPVGATNVTEAKALLPLFVTTNCAVPAACAGAANAIDEPLIVAPVIATPSSVMDDVTPRFAPLMVTVAPPVVESDAGVIAFTMGPGTTSRGAVVPLEQPAANSAPSARYRN
jgi:hypothetical protein